MGWRDWLRNEPQQAVTPTSVMSWEDVLRRYDLVEVIDDAPEPVVVVADRGRTFVDTADMPTAPMLGELGSSSPSPWVAFSRREYNVTLQGLKGLEQYDRMRKSDGVVRGTLRLIKTPPLAGRWFMQPASTSTRDVNAAEFAWKCLTEYMSISWNQVLNEALLCADFGYYMFEKVWDERVIDGKDRMVWQKLAPRHPMDTKQWVFDAHGGPNGVWMYGTGRDNIDSGASLGVSPTGLATGYQTTNGLLTGVSTDLTTYQHRDIFIPIQKLLVFTFDREASNIEGLSVLRSAYKHWYFKEQLYKIDAIQKERHGIGIPVIKLPPGFTVEDKNFANELGRNLRTNERAHVVLPPNWELIFAKMEGHPVDALASIEMHDKAIRENILASFMEKGTSQEDKQDLFLKATRFLANSVCDTFNDYAIPELINYNFSRVGMPRLKVRRIGEQNDWRTLSFAVRNLIGAKALTPDDKLEAHLREEMDFPEMEPNTARVINDPLARAAMGEGNDPTQPQKPTSQAQAKQDMSKNKVGMPRQTPPSSTPPRGNAGTDQSGGK